MKTKVLFVCLGNICRSPSAEAVFKHLVEEKGESKNYFIDSAGTAAYHAGERADARMRNHAKKRGIELTSIARKFIPEDFSRFDYIIAMDQENLHDLKRQARNDEDLKKLHLMTDFSKKYNYNHIPDPYYGGDEGFELVLDLLDDASKGFYESLNKN
jgi:protein-tyrosine phosphatase